MLSKLLKKHKGVEIAKMRSADFFARQREFDLSKLKKVDDGHGWKKVEQCPVCKSKNYEQELLVYGIPLLKCLDCELRYHNRVPNDPNDIYQDEDYSVYTCDDFEENYQYRMNRFGEERVQLLQDHCGDLSDKSVIDVGCGDGIFLSVAKKYFRHCVGTDFSKHLCDFTRERTGLPIYQSSLEELPEKDFDCVTSFDVIEHVHQPVEYMKDINQIMKPGGHLLIYTPNFDSFSIKVMQEDSQLLDGSEHILLFNHASLKKIGEMTGFKIVHTETRGLDIHSIMSYQNFKGKESDCDFLMQWNNELQCVIDNANAADYLRVIYQKC